MKKNGILLCFLICIVMLVMLAGCNSASVGVIGGTDDPTKVFVSGGDKESKAIAQLRIVDGADDGNLVLAGEKETEVYALEVGNIPVFIDGKKALLSDLEDGMPVEIAYNGNIEETFPARLGDVSSISGYSLGTEKNPSGTYYDICGLYINVLNDLWEKDEGLNGGVKYVSVDLSKASGNLTEGEKSAVAWIFASEHQVSGLTLTYDELKGAGYLSQVEHASVPEGKPELYHWEDGVLFSIKAEDSTSAENSFRTELKFDAQKWRSPLGAYFFSNCEAVWPENGKWSEYTIGSEAIS